MRRHVLLYGLVGGVLIALLQWSQYRFVVIEHSVEIYAVLVAAVFATLGIWLGLRMTRRREMVVVREVQVEVPVEVVAVHDPEQADRKREELGMTPREYEILSLIAQGMSNREIAEALFVSENTVKTHSGRVLDKLGAKRRTQAVQIGKELGLLP